MRMLMLGAMAAVALTFVSAPAVAAFSCDEYCVGFCKTAGSKSICLNRCALSCRAKHPGH
jgi:hypothetical protein